MNCELEIEIGAKERTLDRLRDRVYQLEVALRAAEDALDREVSEFYREKTRKQIKRIEADLASARHEMASVREELGSMRASSQQNVESAVNSSEDKHGS
jgi:hypothetical protein